MDFKDTYGGRNDKNSSALIKVKTGDNSNKNLSKYENHRRYTVANSPRGSARNILNPGGLTHFNFI